MKETILGVLLFFFFGASGTLSAQETAQTKQEIRLEKRQQRQLNRLERRLTDSLTYKIEYYKYALLEDLDYRNFENLGWWQFQLNELESKLTDSIPKSPMDSLEQEYTKKMIVSLMKVVVNAYEVEANRPPAIRDLPAIVFLLMLRTVVNPRDYVAYLSIIAYSSKMEDYGTALFYLEAALEHGYQDLETLQALPNTALLRIMPEYQALLEVYFNKGRYGIREEELEESN